MKPVPIRIGRRALIPLVAVFLAAAGCGGGEAADPGEEKEEAPIAFAKCMRERGIDAPDPPPGERGFGFVRPGSGDDEAEFQEAHDACIDEIAQTFAFISDEEEIMFDNLTEFAGCMRGKGIDFPDPDRAVDKGPGEYIKRASDPGDPQFEKADDECRVEVFGGADQGPGGERGTGGGDDPQ